jgi:hypothetical protein
MRLTAAVTGCIAIVLFAAGLRGAEGANSASFTDPTGDWAGGSPDVTAVSIANDDSGLVTIVISFAASRPLVTGMRVGAIFDTDASASTGDPTHLGGEVAMQLDIASNSWAYYRWNGSTLERLTSTTGSITYTSTATTISVNRSELSGTSRINFYVFGDFNASSTETDLAPGAGQSWAYTIAITTPTTTTTTTTAPPPATTAPPPATTAPPPTTTNRVTIESAVDTDRDGVLDKSDACPKTRGGAYDKNKNGCPGPFPAIRVPTGDNLRPSKSSGGVTTYESPRNMIRNLPAGAQVQLRFGGQRERLRADKTGAIKSQLLLRNGFRHGAKVEIWAWKPGWIGFGVQLVVRTRAPFASVANRRCIAPTASAPRPCNQVSRGR